MSDNLKLWNPESELSPLLLLMLGNNEVSLFAHEDVLENISVKAAGVVLELADLDRLDRLGVRDSEGLLFLPDRFLILVQKWKS